MRVACKIFPNFPEYFPVPIDPDKRAIGRDIKKYLAINRISREEFSFQTKLGKSTID
jgi:hypothetical protein